MAKQMETSYFLWLCLTIITRMSEWPLQQRYCLFLISEFRNKAQLELWAKAVDVFCTSRLFILPKSCVSNQSRMEKHHSASLSFHVCTVWGHRIVSDIYLVSKHHGLTSWPSGSSNKVLIAFWFFLIEIALFSNMVKTGTMLQEVCAAWLSRATWTEQAQSAKLWKLLQKYEASWSEDRDRRVTNDYDDFDISCRQLCFFHFLANCLSSGPVLVGFPLGLVWALRFLLNLTFVSKKMVDMQNVERRAPHAWVLLAVWEMRYEECLLGYNR